MKKIFTAALALAGSTAIYAAAPAAGLVQHAEPVHSPAAPVVAAPVVAAPAIMPAPVVVAPAAPAVKPAVVAPAATDKSAAKPHGKKKHKAHKEDHKLTEALNHMDKPWAPLTEIKVEKKDCPCPHANKHKDGKKKHKADKKADAKAVEAPKTAAAPHATPAA